MSANDKEMVKFLLRGFAILSKIISCYDSPSGMQETIDFASRSLDRIESTTALRVGRKFKDVDPWKGVKLKKDVHIERLTRFTIELVWFSMKFGQFVNAMRRAWGRKEIDFIHESAVYDQEVRHGKSQAEEELPS